jgi:hypothetical protein
MSFSAGIGTTKAAARIALLGVDAASSSVLAECFRQFGIDAVKIPAGETNDVGGAYHACVVPLEAGSESALRAIRQASHRAVVYGVCGSVKEALRYAEHGINAVFHTPINKQEALQVVRSTHLLVLKELRRYVRVPLLCSVRLETGTEILEASSLEVSAGGMSLVVKGHVVVPQAVLAIFALPGEEMIGVKSVVCWTRNDEGTAAIRFDPSDPRRIVVREWIDHYLDA